MFLLVACAIQLAMSRPPFGEKHSIEKKCEVCRKVFRVFFAWLRDGKAGKFCSRKCQHIGRKRKQPTILTAVCKECQKKFQRTKHRAGSMDFCSIKCMATARGKNMRGANHPGWNGGVSERSHLSRQIIRNRIKEIGKCERCGAMKYLQGHHKIHYSQNKELGENPNNVEILCSNCHATEHPQWNAMIIRPRIRSGFIKSCLRCGKKFYVSPYLLTISKYCSRDCHYNKREKMLICVICQKTFVAKGVRIETAKCCSLRCAGELGRRIRWT